MDFREKREKPNGALSFSIPCAYGFLDPLHERVVVRSSAAQFSVQRIEYHAYKIGRVLPAENEGGDETLEVRHGMKQCSLFLFLFLGGGDRCPPTQPVHCSQQVSHVPRRPDAVFKFRRSLRLLSRRAHSPRKCASMISSIEALNSASIAALTEPMSVALVGSSN